MIKVFSVKSFGYGGNDKYVILWTKPNKLMGSSFAESEKDAKEAVENLKRNGSFQNIAMFRPNENDKIAKWKEDIRKKGFYTSRKEAEKAGAI